MMKNVMCREMQEMRKALKMLVGKVHGEETT
jgi:hypothetical protein